MREKLNSNPLAQVAVIGVLLVVVGVFVMSSMGGGSGSSSTATTATTASTSADAATAASVAPAPTAAVPVASPTAPVAPPLPHAVTTAWSADRTVVVLFVRHGGIDDRMVVAAEKRLGSFSDVAAFVVPADRIARYAAIAQGVDLNRVPALVVLRPKRLDGGIPNASVSYGFQTPQNIAQAVIDAGYKGPTVPYHP